MKSSGSRFNLDIAPNSQILLDDKLLVADENVPPSITLIHDNCPGQNSHSRGPVKGAK